MVATTMDPTGREQPEEGSWQWSAHLRLILEQLPAVLWSTDTDLHFTSSLGAGLAPLQLRPGQVVGTSLFEFFQTDDPEHPSIQVHRRALCGTPVRYELEWAGRIFQVQVEPLRSPDGEIAGTVGLALDVTERKEAEAALGEVEERYRTLVEQVPGVIYVEALAGGANPYISPQVQTLLGYRPEEVTANPKLWMSRVHPDDYRRVAEEVHRTDATGEPYRMEYRMVARDGRVVWVHNEAALIHDDASRPRFWHGLVMDITDRKAAEERLLRSESRFRVMVQNALDIITILETDGTIRYKSPGVERELGCLGDELIGTNVFSLVHPDDVTRAQELFSELLSQAAEKVVAEIRCRHKGGSWRWLEVVGTNLLADPSVGGIVVNSRDITERKAFEARLAHQAYHDPLTDLPNRVLFTERLAAAINSARQEGVPVSVVLLDLDGFKLVNDSHGHAAGDQLLAAVGRCLQEHLPPAATLARLGGDEFAALLERVADRTELGGLAEKLIEALRPPSLSAVASCS